MIDGYGVFDNAGALYIATHSEKVALKFIEMSKKVHTDLELKIKRVIIGVME